MPAGEKQIFLEAIDVPWQRRTAFLDGACGDDAVLRGRLEALLAAHDRTVSLTELGAESIESEIAAVGASRAGTRIDGYRLIEPIGEGGFGTVYRAQQEEPIRREVALKIIKPGMDSDRVIARFETERQTLALMDHPGIARVLDAGTTASDRPYFVMELVRGAPITEHCDRGRLTVARRLELFGRVCMAVHHAHQKGIIHRDLKPSNVLVTSVDDRPVPKVIDFGIAKATVGWLADGMEVTVAHQVVGTPAYMSPEQAEGGAADIDTRSDIYALGVLLYELLTGTPAFDPERLRSAGLRELQRIIAEEQPPRPSTRITTMIAPVGESGGPEAGPSAHDTTGAEAIARLRSTEPGDLRRQLAGDLDWIVMRALEKDRTRRYDSAAALARDVERHLAHEPVDAGPPSARYRIGKLVRRHRLAVGAAAAMALVLLAATAISSAFAVHASRQRARAERGETEAVAARSAEEAARIEAERIAGFSQRMLGGIDPATAGDLDKTLMRIVLDDAAAAAQQELGAFPAVEAAIRHTIGQAYVAIGDYEAADPHLRAAVELRHVELGPDHALTLESEAALCDLLVSWARVDEAQEHCGAVLAARIATLGPEHPLTLVSRAAAARLLHVRGALDEADDAYCELLALRRDLLGDEHRATLATVQQLGRLLKERGRLLESEQLLRPAVETARRVLGDDDLDTLSVAGSLAGTLYALGRYGEAEPLRRLGAEQSRRIRGHAHPDTLTSINNLGVVLSAMDRTDEAESLYREALAGRERVLGPDHPRTLGTRSNLASLLSSAGRFEEADAVMLDAIERARRTLGAEHPVALRLLAERGEHLLERGDLTGAEAETLDALAGRREALGADHPDTLTSLVTLGNIQKRLGRGAESLATLREALEAQRRTLGNEHPDTLVTLSNLTSAMMSNRAATEAEPLVRDLLEARIRTLGPEHSRTLRARHQLGACLMQQRRYDEAEPVLRELIDAWREARGDEHPMTLSALNNLGSMLWESGRPAEALPLLEEALATRARLLGETHGHTLNTRANLAMVLLDLERYADAEKQLRTLIAGCESSPGKESWIGPLVADLGRSVLLQGRAADAEPILRDALATLERDMPEDWRTARTTALLGAALLEQDRLAEAEPLLVSGADRMLEAPGRASWRRWVRRQLVTLYERMGRPEQAESWREPAASEG